MDLNSDEVLDFSNPNRTLKEKIFDTQLNDLDNHLPKYAKKYFLEGEFTSVREMVTKMITLSEITNEEITEEKFKSFFDTDTSNVALPLFASSVACGFPSPADDYIEKHLSLDKHLIKNPASTFFIKASGDSMYPKICDGDLLIVDRSLGIASGQLVLATLDGDFTVKRLIKLNNQFVLCPENPTYNEIIVTEERDFSVWGVVTYIINQAQST